MVQSLSKKLKKSKLPALVCKLSPLVSLIKAALSERDFFGIVVILVNTVDIFCNALSLNSSEQLANCKRKQVALSKVPESIIPNKKISEIVAQ